MQKFQRKNLSGLVGGQEGSTVGLSGDVGVHWAGTEWGHSSREFAYAKAYYMDVTYSMVHLGNWESMAYLRNCQWCSIAGKKRILAEDRGESWADQGGSYGIVSFFSVRSHLTPWAADHSFLVLVHHIRSPCCVIFVHLSSPLYCK